MENTGITYEQNQERRNTLFFPALIALVGSIILVVAFFLPYSSATEEYKEYLRNNSDSMYFEEIGMTNGEAVGISMLEFGRMYAKAAEMGMSEAVSIICMVLIAIIGLFSLLTLLFAILKKPIVLFIFNALNFGIFSMLNWDFRDRGIMPTSSYDWGISYYLYYIGALGALVGAVYLFIAKIKIKKQKKPYNHQIFNNENEREEKVMKRLIAILLPIILLLLLTACGDDTTSGNSDEIPASSQQEEGEDNPEESKDNNEENQDLSVTINPSPDKYTWYIKNYVGKNCASLGYTSIGGERLDEYGAGLLELVFVSTDGSYVDIESDEALKEYSVIGQNLAPNTELKLVFGKDSEGNEYDNLVVTQSFEEIVLSVKKVGTPDKETTLTAIKPSPDKYTWYIADYVGRNLSSCGYTSIRGDLLTEYGAAVVKFIIIADDGSFIDPADTELLKNYVVTEQNIKPNSELKLVFDKDSNGVEYDNLVESQNIEEIELYVKQIPGSQLNVSEKSENTDTETIPEASSDEPESSTSSDELVDGIRPEFKEAMDSYEAFYDEYCDFMKKYKENPTDSELLAKYTDMATELIDMQEEFAAWENKELNNAEMKYYLEVTNRITQKLFEVAE